MSRVGRSIPKRGAGKGRRAKTPLDVRLTVRVRFGDGGDETVTMMDDRSIPMVDSVFAYRDRILKGMTRLLYTAATLQPRLARELKPLVGRLRGRRSP